MQSRQTRLRTRSCVPVLGSALTAFILCTMPAGAQWIGAPGGDGSAPSTGTVTIAPAPSQGMGPGMTMPGARPAAPQGGGGDPSAAADCQAQVMKRREDLEARGGALEKAAKAKRPPSELCPLFRNFVSSQQNFYTYLNGNKARCGVPDDVLATLKKNVASVTTTRNKVCEVAKLQESGGGGGGNEGPPPQGAVSAGLGLPSGLPSVGAPKGGMFDTLGGDALR